MLAARGFEVKPDESRSTSLRISNVVHMSSMHCVVPVETFSVAVGGRYKGFPAAVIPLRVPTCLARVFRTGSHHVVGTRHPLDALLATYLVSYELRKCNIVPFVAGVQVCNMVGSVSLGFGIDLRALEKSFPLRVTYQPQLFEGAQLVWSRRDQGSKRKKPKTTTLIVFDTGKIVITGGESVQSIATTFRNVLPILHMHAVPLIAASEAETRKRRAPRARSSHSAPRDREADMEDEEDADADVQRALNLVGGTDDSAPRKRRKIQDNRSSSSSKDTVAIQDALTAIEMHPRVVEMDDAHTDLEGDSTIIERASRVVAERKQKYRPKFGYGPRQHKVPSVFTRAGVAGTSVPEIVTRLCVKHVEAALSQKNNGVK